MQTPLDFLVIGHAARDAQPDGTFRLGGTVTYAALLAARLDMRVGIVTSGTPREAADLMAAIPGAEVACKPAATPTVFENSYEGDRRTQYLRARAEPLTAADVPIAWRATPIALLGPIADEVEASVSASLVASSGILGATPQGWLRRWDVDGRVRPATWSNAGDILPHLGALVCSVEDVAIAAGDDPAREVVAAWAARVPRVVVTDGPRGARLWEGGEEVARVPAFVSEEVDPTGAGDTFAAAFLIALRQGRSPLDAVRYAHAAASFVVAAPGTSGIPSEAQIAARLEMRQ